MLDFVFSNRFALRCVEKHKPRWVPIGNKKTRERFGGTRIYPYFCTRNTNRTTMNIKNMNKAELWTYAILLVIDLAPFVYFHIKDFDPTALGFGLIIISIWLSIFSLVFGLMFKFSGDKNAEIIGNCFFVNIVIIILLNYQHSLIAYLFHL